MYLLYRSVTTLIVPLMPHILARRLARGKEDAARLPERLGKATLPRPAGKLLWIHAASVGEANAALPLIEMLLKEHVQLHVILTTVTVTSAALMQKRLPARALHQFAPVDTPGAVHAFLDHWRPDVALFVDSELWPNLIMQSRKRGTVMGIINARMSQRSFKRWQLARSFISGLLSSFTICFAQSAQDASRMKILGVPSITGTGNLKYDVPALACDEQEYAQLKSQIGGRSVLTAASTHPGEETLLAEVHGTLKAQGLQPLTIIVPRHAVRGHAIAAELGSFNLARRSRGDVITADTDIYLADTMGELGLFYRLASVVFIGGTLVAHGGQNPLEPAQLGCAIIAGPHMENFAGIAATMQEEGAIIRIKDVSELTMQSARLLADEKSRAALGQNAMAHIRAHGGMLPLITRELQRYLD